jgi:hypothetical protein
VRRAFAVIPFLAAFWAAIVALSGGLAFSLGSVRVSSSDAIRPLIVAAIAALAYVAWSRPARVHDDVDWLRRRLTPFRLAVTLSAATLALGVANNSWGAGGSDSYSYVSQMDLWLHGDLKVPISLAAEVPWPNALETFTPFGYRAVPNELTIAPITGPGLPLLMAAFKIAGGHAAAFLVVPISGALLVWTTFLIGRRVVSERVGLGGAWLVATSPTFLMMFKSQMSDVPAAAFWALATYWILGTTARSAVLAGLAASVAILIRPNLVPIAAVLAAWPLVGQLKATGPRRAATFALAAVPGCLAVAAINNWLYGSPLSSGYGELSSLFSIARVPVTLAAYARWLAETQTPIVLAGALFIIWMAPLLGGVLLAAWALYAAYPAFDAWWFLRFLLPSWPAMFIGTAGAIVWLFEKRMRYGRAAATVALLALGGYGLAITAQRHVFTRDEGERRYATIAQLVKSQTEDSAMILASIHAGSLRYYAGRATLRFDLLDEAWLDRAAAWLQANGRHPYVVVEDWELPVFTKRFGGRNSLGELRLAPALVYEAYRIPGKVYLFDVLRAGGPTTEPPPIRDPWPRCPLPASPPRF